MHIPGDWEKLQTASESSFSVVYSVSVDICKLICHPSDITSMRLYQ